MKLFACFLLVAASAFGALPALAAPLTYYNSPFDTPNSATNSLITQINSAFPSTSYPVSCTGTTAATCQGTKLLISTTGLTTAAGVTAATTTVTDASVAATSIVFCQPIGYAGTGNPIDVVVVPAAGSFTFNIQNTHACFVYN